MDWSLAVDIYCERTSAAFWAEPLNALSNAAFPAAALWAARSAKLRQITAPIVWVLITIAALIGLGSFLFHTFANAWSELADTLPIWSFVGLFVLTAMHYIGGMSVQRVARVAGLVALSVGLTVWLLASGENAGTNADDPLNGSGQYAPALLALLVFSALTWRRKHPAAPWILAATATFCASLTLRTVDMAFCAAFPSGTHFMWHLLNALMIGLLLQMLLRNLPNR